MLGARTSTRVRCRWSGGRRNPIVWKGRCLWGDNIISICVEQQEEKEKE
jgi:hypothetical protein